MICVHYAQQLHCLNMCQCVEGCVKSTEAWLNLFLCLKFLSSLHPCENCVGRVVVVSLATFRENMEAANQKSEQKLNFWSRFLRESLTWHLHIISWVRSTRDITGFLSDPSYAMILTKMAKFVRKFFCPRKISCSYLFCHGVDEPNINILFLSNTWNGRK